MSDRHVNGEPARGPKRRTDRTALPATVVTQDTVRSRPRSPSETATPKLAVRRPAARGEREPRKLGPVLKFFNALLTFFVIVGLGLGGGFIYLNSGLDADGPLEQSKLIAIPRNDGTLNIADRLEREGAISNRYTFLLSYWLMGRQAAWGGGKSVQIKAGEYEFKQAASLRSVIDTLSEGRTVMMRVTIPEGLTSHQIVERLKGDPGLTGELRDVPAEGSLLPETYSLPRGSSRLQVVEAMQAAQKKLVDQLWAERRDGSPFKSPAEALIMASVVEKETGKNDERDRVAAVFTNRLRLGMQLQSDPTILYGKFGGKVQWGATIFQSMIREQTAHNTYVIKGLPPTPICNPGRQAIEATLKPAQTKDLYFVADGKGGHVFTENLKDHNAAVQRYRAWEAEQAQKRAAAAAAAAQPAAPAQTPQTIVQPTTINAKQPAAPAPKKN